jgi:hypothetical protein
MKPLNRILKDMYPKKLHSRKGSLLMVGVLLTLWCLTINTNAQLITKIGQLNSENFAIEESVTTAPHTQDANGINFNSSFPLGATLGGLFTTATPKDWSVYNTNDFGLVMNISGTNPNMSFTIEFYDSDLGIANTFTGASTLNTGSDIFMPLTLSTPGLGTMNDILGVQFTWDSPDSINATWKEIGVVPEPSTVKLLIMGSLGVGIVALLKRKRKVKST